MTEKEKFEHWVISYVPQAGKPLDLRKNKFGSYYHSSTRAAFAAWLASKQN